MNTTSANRVANHPIVHGKIYENIMELAGNTPMVRLGKLARHAGCRAEVLVKLEYLNPLGSVKDRIAISMIEALEDAGAIHPDSVIVEPTAGNTGIALASVCAVKGYRCILTMPSNFSIERRKMVSLFGAELALTPAEDGIQGAIQRANEIVAETENAVMPWQYGNPANPDIHRKTTAREIWSDTSGHVDAVVLGVGTGGTLTGIADALRALKPEIRIFAVEPANSPILSGGMQFFPHQIQGIGTGFIPTVLDVDNIDEVLTVTDEEAIQTALELATFEGIPGGISSGAALSCALRLAARQEMTGKTVVTILPGSMERDFSDTWFDSNEHTSFNR